MRLLECHGFERPSYGGEDLVSCNLCLPALPVFRPKGFRLAGYDNECICELALVFSQHEWAKYCAPITCVGVPELSSLHFHMPIFRLLSADCRTLRVSWRGNRIEYRSSGVEATTEVVLFGVWLPWAIHLHALWVAIL